MGLSGSPVIKNLPGNGRGQGFDPDQELRSHMQTEH